jgi:ABC-type uncharacterized transport system involved in gliding motility auxiliary subunit
MSERIDLEAPVAEGAGSGCHAGAETMREAAAFALSQPDPMMLEQMWRGAARAEILALQVSGALPSAFAAAPATAAPADAAAGHLAQSAASAQVVLVADSDFLLDQLYVDPSAANFLFDNAAFSLNAIDQLGGSDALIALRSRAPANRRMTVVDDLEQQAREAFQRRLEEAEAAQRATEDRLAALQARGGGSGFFTGDAGAELTPEESRELSRFLIEAERLGGEVRAIRRDLRREVDRLETTITGLNLWLAPLLVAAIGVFFFWRRSRRASQTAPARVAPRATEGSTP